jgi:hypothetical protein
MVRGRRWREYFGIGDWRGPRGTHEFEDSGVFSIQSSRREKFLGVRTANRFITVVEQV